MHAIEGCHCWTINQFTERSNIPPSCFRGDVDEQCFRLINDAQYQRLEGIFAGLAVSDMRTAFVAVTLSDVIDVNQMIEPGRKFIMEIVRVMANLQISNFVTIKEGNFAYNNIYIRLDIYLSSR